jgi:hypothetical protein
MAGRQEFTFINVAVWTPTEMISYFLSSVQAGADARTAAYHGVRPDVRAPIGLRMVARSVLFPIAMNNYRAARPHRIVRRGEVLA